MAQQKEMKMKNWLIEKLGGVPKQTYMATAESYEDILATYTNMIHKLGQENAAMKAEKAEMEKAVKWLARICLKQSAV